MQYLIYFALVLLQAAAGWADGHAPTRIEGRLTFQDSVDFALTHHPGLEVAQSEWRAAQARVQEAEGAFWPKLAAGLYVNAGNTPMIVAGAPNVEAPFWSALGGGALSLNLSAMLPLYTGGRLQARLGQAKAEERAQLARTALTLREVARDARRAYYDALQAAARRESARWKLAQQEELLRITLLKIKLGSLAVYVQRRFEAEVAAARQALNTAEAEERVARINLSVALGGAVDSTFELAPAPRGELPLQTLAQDVQQSLQERPDLIVARALIEASDQRLQQTLAAYSPQLSLYAMGERMRQPAFAADARSEGGYQVGLVVSWSLFDRERGAREEEAAAMLEVKRSEVRRLEQVVEGEVARSRARLEAALPNEELAALEIQAAEAELKIARLRFELGRGIYLEVLESLAALARARQNVLSSQRERGVAEADFLYALGRLK